MLGVAGRAWTVSNLLLVCWVACCVARLLFRESRRVLLRCRTLWGLRGEQQDAGRARDRFDRRRHQLRPENMGQLTLKGN